MTCCYLFDIDGTIANIEHRLHHITGAKKDWAAFYAACDKDVPILYMMELMHHLNALAPVLLVTGRSEECRDATETWLLKHHFGMGSRLFMRSIGDHRPDNIVKGELLDHIVAEGWTPIMAFEDRTQVVKMWRSRGVPCAQVADGDF